jgi:hypothetical protein
MESRPPYTKDFVCTIHNRPGDHPEEITCGAFLFKPAEDAPADAGESSHAPYAPGASSPGPWVPTTAAKAYRLRPAPSEVIAAPDGDLMMVSVKQGPAFAMPRDMFFAFFELVEPEDLPETEGALAKAPPLAHDVATTALLDPKGGQPAAPAAPPASDDEESSK